MNELAGHGEEEEGSKTGKCSADVRTATEI